MEELISIKDLQISYMGRQCTIDDYIKYSKEPNTCPDLSKVGAIVYIKKIVDNIDIPRGMFGVDKLMEILQNDMDECNFLLIKCIQRLKLKRVPAYLVDLIISDDEDVKFDLFFKFLKSCNIGQ